MLTDLNRSLLSELGFDLTSFPHHGPTDLVIAIRTRDGERAEVARAAVDAALADLGRRPAGGTAAAAHPPRTLAAAARSADVDLALISVPGEYVLVEALDAIRAGLHVMISAITSRWSMTVCSNAKLSGVACWSWGRTAAPRFWLVPGSGSRTLSVAAP